MPSLFIYSTCIGWPPVAEGVIALKKKPINEYFVHCIILVLIPKDNNIICMDTPSIITYISPAIAAQNIKKILASFKASSILLVSSSFKIV